MSRPIGFQRLALDEFNEAIAWYERQEPGLGRRFAAATDAAFARIDANPKLFRQSLFLMGNSHDSRAPAIR